MDRKIGLWTLHDEIGRGGMGVVYRATHDILEGEFAVKAIRPELSVDPEFRQRFFREASVTANLDHPNVIKVRDPFESDGQLFFPMELLSGASLKELIEGDTKPWPVDQAVAVITQAGLGLGHAHRHPKKVVHRDVKPGNIQVQDDGSVRVLDFGLARTHVDKSITATGKAVGTPAYMSPEVLWGKTATARSDVYSLGVVLFRLLAGRLPFEMPEDESSVAAVLLAVASAHERGLPDVRQFKPGISPKFAALVSACLSKDPDRRPADGIAMADMLSACNTAEGGSSVVDVGWILERYGAAEHPKLGVASPIGRGAGTVVGAGADSGAGPAISPEKVIASLKGVGAPVGDETCMVDITENFAGSYKAASAPPAVSSRHPAGDGESGRASRCRHVAVWAIIIALMLAGLVGVGVWWFGFEAQAREAGRQAAKEIDWVRILGGTFQMGADDSDATDYEKPVHGVTLSTFEIAKMEVTVGQYKKCVDAGACSVPDSGGDCNWDTPGREDHPVNCVDWNQAVAFAKWVGGRLPTEAEWEYAARSGGRSQKYPWGEQPATCSYAVMRNGKDSGCGRDSTWPVCLMTIGNTSQGLCDMAGNVEEWVSDQWNSYGAGSVTNPTGPWMNVDSRVVRGGRWGSDAGEVRAAHRSSTSPRSRGDGLGLRVARSVR